MRQKRVTQVSVSKVVQVPAEELRKCYQKVTLEEIRRCLNKFEQAKREGINLGMKKASKGKKVEKGEHPMCTVTKLKGGTFLFSTNSQDLTTKREKGV